MKLLKLSHAGVFLVVFSGYVLSACDNGNAPGPGSVPNVITGIVSAPSADSSDFIASVGIFDPLISLAVAGFTSTANAAVSGLVPVGGATVQLVRLNNQGQVSSVIASTTSSGGGGYVFINTPAPDSTLEVRVTGQSAVMRAIVTGSEVDISPASEAVVGGIVNALSGGVTLGNFAVEEVAALTNLVAGMDVDLTGKTFAQSLTAIQNASSPILGNLVAGFSASGAETVLYNSLYGGLQFESVVNDTFTLGAGEGGIEMRSFVGGWGYDDSGLVTGGNLFGNITRHILTELEAPLGTLFSENGVWNIVATDGQVVTMNPEGSTTVGAVTADGSLMVYPVETKATGVLGRGLMLAVRKTVKSTPDTPVLDNTVLDAAGSPGTIYNLVRLKETFSGPQSVTGQNLAAVTTETGTLTFDSDDTVTFPESEENEYAALSVDVNSTQSLALDLDSGAIISSTPSVEAITGRYLVPPDGSGVIMKNSDGTFLGQGYVTGNGKVLTLATPADLIQFNLNVLANDSDPDAGDTLTINNVTTPVLGGTVTINTAGNQLLYIPPNNVNSGTEQFTYSVSDGTTTRTGTVSFDLTATNTAPVANSNQFNVAVNSSANLLDVLANDSDINIGQKLTISAASVTTKLGGGGSVTINSAGNRLVYTPPANTTGLEVLSYTVTDGIDTATAAVAVMTVLASTGNTAPTAVDDSGTSVAMNSSLNVLDVLANDSDPDAGNSLTITQVGATNHGGTVTRVADISGPNRLLSYTPAPGYSGTETFTYTVSDGAATDTASVTVTVIGVGNTVPEAEDDAGNIVQDSNNNVLDVLANDHDNDVGTALTITQVDATNAHGSVTINGAGPNNSLLYKPTAAYEGSASFTYTISDGTATDTATVTLAVVGPPYTASIAVDDVDYHVGENSSGNLLAVLANDNDLGGALSITAASITTPLGSGGTVTVNGSNNRLIYTPPAGVSGTEVLSYTVSDGTLTDTGSVTVTVMPSNAAPVANDDSINITVDTTGNDLDVLANDTDPDVGDALTITQVDATNAHGSVTINGAGPNNTVLYTPTAAYQGSDASFTYTISDGIATDTATVTLTVGNAAPAAANDGFNVAVDIVPNTLDVLANDSDADVPAQTLTISATDATSAQGGTVTNNGSNLSYTPSPAAVLAGTDSFGYTVSDGIATTSATVTVTVGANMAPNPAGDVFTVLENSGGNALDVLANDSDVDVPAQSLTITAASVTTPLGVGGNVSINVTNDGLLYTPVAATTGTEILSYTVSDGVTATSASVTVTVEANVAPTAGDDNYRVDKNSSGNALSVLANDTDSNVPAQTLTISAADTASAQGGTVSINGTNNGLIYAPASGFSGSDTFSYTVTDNSTPPITDTATVTVTVGAPANTPPVAQDDDNDLNTSGFTVNLGSSNNPLDVLANDSDADVGDTLTISLVGANPTSTTSAQGGTVTNNGSNITYAPLAGFSGTDTFTYTVTDGKNPVSANVSVTVLGIGNTAPAAVPDSGLRVRKDSSGNVLDVLANDSDADAGDTLTIVQVGSAAHGSVAINGSNDKVIYTPAASYSGIDTFTYTVSDGTDTATATVAVNVVLVNGLPVALNDGGYMVLSGSSDNVLNVLANDYDLDVGDTVTISLVDSNPSSAPSPTTAPSQNGGTVVNNGSTVSYTPAANFTGFDSFTYTLSDGTDTDTAVVTLTVVAGNTPPIAVNDSGYHVGVGSSNNTLNVLANDSDVDVGDTLSITQVGTASAGGTVIVNGTGNALIYSPAAAYNGNESFTYTISDGYSTAQATVTVTVTDTNAAPVVVADTSWAYVVQSEEERTTNLANREIGMAIRQATGLSNNILHGSTYNVVQHASYFTSSGSDVAVETGYKFGTLSFSGGGVISGSLLGKRASLDIEAAKSGVSSALTTLASATETISSGSYSVNPNGTMTLTLGIGGATVTGNGAVSSDGEVIAVAIRVTEGGDDTGRGLLFLVRQP